MASAVAIATILSLVGAYVRAPEALLGVAFARACAAERAAMERTQPRLRVDREDMQLEDVDGLPPSIDGMKTGSPPRERAEQPSMRGSALALSRFASTPGGRPERDPGVEWLPIGPPTRERARLMVFLN